MGTFEVRQLLSLSCLALPVAPYPSHTAGMTQRTLPAIESLLASQSQLQTLTLDGEGEASLANKLASHGATHAQGAAELSLLNVNAIDAVYLFRVFRSQRSTPSPTHAPNPTPPVIVA